MRQGRDTITLKNQNHNKKQRENYYKFAVTIIIYLKSIDIDLSLYTYSFYILVIFFLPAYFIFFFKFIMKEIFLFLLLGFQLRIGIALVFSSSDIISGQRTKVRRHTTRPTGKWRERVEIYYFHKNKLEIIIITIRRGKTRQVGLSDINYFACLTSFLLLRISFSIRWKWYHNENH